MSSRAARWVLAASALPFGGIGAAFLGWPHEMARHLELEITGATGTTDLRAVYGGLQIGIAVLLLLGAARSALTRCALATAVAGFAGLAAARVAGLAVDGGEQALNHLLLAGELVGLAACGTALWSRH
jgi:hypothetical protein